MTAPVPDENSARSRPVSYVLQHPTLLLGVSGSLLISVKLLAVANWNATTAFGILSAAGTSNVLVGAFLGVLPLVYLSVGLTLVSLIERWVAKKTKVEKAAAGTLWVWSIILTVLIVPIGLILGAVVGVLLFAGVRFWSYRSKSVPKGGENRVSRFESWSVTLGFTVYAVFFSLSVPWMAPEVIEVEQKEVAAYVLSVSDGRATILLARNRALEYVDARDIKGEFCQMTASPWLVALPEVVTGSKYPLCPK